MSVNHSESLDRAISATFDEHEPGRIVTEWLLIAVTQGADDNPCASRYVTRYRPGMLHHHIRGLVDVVDEMAHLEDSDDD